MLENFISRALSVLSDARNKIHLYRKARNFSRIALFFTLKMPAPIGLTRKRYSEVSQVATVLLEFRLVP